MSFAFGIQAIHPSDATHILGFSSARTGSTDLLLDIWNGSTSAARVFAVQKDGRVEMSDGTVSAPVLTFLSDLDSGLYRIGADNLGVAVGGSKVLDIGASTIAITGNLSLSGNVSSGTWQGTAITAAKGGTGLTSYSTGNLIYASGATTLAKLALGTTNTVLTSSGSAPQWSTALSVSTVSTSSTITSGGKLTVSSGGVDVTGAATFANNVKVQDDGTASGSTGATSLVVGKNAGDFGITVYSGSTDEGALAFKSSGDEMALVADHAAGTLTLLTDRGAVPEEEKLTWDGSTLYLRESANADMTQGITVNQGANDDEALAFKSSDVAHAITSLAETDTYASFRKSSALTGGLEMRAVAESGGSDAGFRVQAVSGMSDTTKSTAARGVMEFRGHRNNAGSLQTVQGNVNLAVVMNEANAKWLVDADGDAHYDGATNAGAWDDHDDVGLLSTLRAATMRDPDTARRWFGDWVDHAENRKILEETGVVTYNDDGHHFVSTKGLNALMIDAIRQTNERWQGAVRDLIERNHLDAGPELAGLLEAGR